MVDTRTHTGPTHTRPQRHSPRGEAEARARLAEVATGERVWREMCASGGGARTVAKLELCRILLRSPSARRRHPQGSRACPGEALLAPRPESAACLKRLKGERGGVKALSWALSVHAKGVSLSSLSPFKSSSCPLLVTFSVVGVFGALLGSRPRERGLRGCVCGRDGAHVRPRVDR